jgi:uncharacterized protein (TIGR03435 family)
VHVESEETPAFALVVAKGGLKIKPVDTSACDLLPGRAGAPLINGYPGSVLTPPRGADDVRRGQKPSCGMWSRRNGPNMVIVAGVVPLDALLMQLGGQLGGVRVINRTGTTDRYNFVLEFVIDENTPGPLRRARPAFEQAEASDIPPEATIFSAIEDQLGLKLEPAKAPREFIVIDHVERPTPN